MSQPRPVARFMMVPRFFEKRAKLAGTDAQGEIR
jgi:hypothetical protein